MDAVEKLGLLGGSASDDVCGVCPSAPSRPLSDVERSITAVAGPGGRPMKLLKVLQSNACARNCRYCGTRRGRDFRRGAYSPDELARLFIQLHRAGCVEGLFLSSAIVGRSEYTMEQIVATAEILRQRYRFSGYVHLKIMPAASDAAIERAMALANRVSVNLEAPNPRRLAHLAPEKAFEHDLLVPLRRVKALADAQGRYMSQTTQFVVGPAGESDRELLATTERLYREIGLARVYYSAFRPVPDTPLENHPRTPPKRQDRLYQADFLLRDYGFTADELIFGEEGLLPSQDDPKTLWALAHPEFFPIAVNRAGRYLLLRVPGIGPRSAERIVNGRRRGKLLSLRDLRQMGTNVRRAAPFVLLDGQRAPTQLSFWDR